MNEHSIIQRLFNAKDSLKATIQKILDLNRQLKSSRKAEEVTEDIAIKQELKLLNKVADHQAKIVQLYEYRLKEASNWLVAGKKKCLLRIVILAGIFFWHLGRENMAAWTFLTPQKKSRKVGVSFAIP